MHIERKGGFSILKINDSKTLNYLPALLMPVIFHIIKGIVLNTPYNTYTLTNGLRVIHLHSDSNIVYCGYQIAVGSRDEEPGEEGLAHFCEHVTFKGTARRSALQIINALESVGGELNAFTNKEDTAFYAALLKEHFPKTVDLLSDIVFHSTYPQHEIDKEVEVICDEIESYNDSPAELIYDDFENTVFNGHPLGHNILGKAENVRNFTSDDARRFTSKHYVPENMIFFCMGDVDFQQIIRLLEKHTPRQQSTPRTEKNTTLWQSESKAEEHFVNRGTHQAHVMIGGRAYDVHNKKRMPLYLLNNIIGGPGMNTRLNLTLRERNGLVYAVESTMVNYGDTGMWTTYFGCDAKDVRRCRRLVRRELDRLMDHPLSDAQLRAAKKQIKGQIALACENRENLAIDFGKAFLHYGWEKDVTALYARIDTITAEEIQSVAREIFDAKRLTTLIYE